MNSKGLRLTTMVLAAMIGFGSAGVANISEAATRAELAQISVNQKGTDFKYWNKKSVPFQALKSYVKDVTDPKSKNFIPVEDRIVVFDLDGTLVGETTPSYFEWMMYLERALNDETFTPSQEDRAYAEEVKKAIEEVGIPNPRPERNRNMPKDMDRRQAMSQGSVFSGMTLDEYEQFVKKFMDTKAEGLTNLKRGEAFYLPMVEVVSYLHANDFKIFIVSGTDRQALRILTDGVLPVDNDNIIGTDIDFEASNQNDADGLEYVFQKEDEVIRDDFILKNIKMNKVVNIVREIGKQPVIAFGNSSGDASMFNYTITNNKYKSLAFALLCDDLERELGSMEKADKMRASCEKYGWIPVSMRDDFKTIYGNNVTRAVK